MTKRANFWRLVLLAMLPVLWLFGPALASGGSFVFRDAGHYYRPLYEYVHAEWMAGRAPLWNPYENCGQPLAADPTAAVFYPGKLLYLLPLLPGQKFTVYVLAHVLLAGAGAFSLARAWNASTWAGLCAAIAYAGSGSVLFQYCNVIFLVGAAWLPYTLVAAHAVLARSSWRAALGLGLAWALIVLGGDIQMAYHAALLVLGYIALYAISHRARVADRPQASLAARRTLCLFLGAGVVGLSLAAVQLWPTFDYGPRTDRADYDAPRSVYEGFDLAAWCGEPEAGTHHAAIYDFSVGPWRLIEFIWPNVSGKTFPQNRRWLNLLPAEDRTWTPSLYFGLLPLVLAFLNLRLFRAGVEQRYASWLVVLGLLASFGRFGMGWLVREVAYAFAGIDPQHIALGQPVGGLYWFFVTFLPGYAMFRYPAKWLVVAALGASVLAARGFDECTGSDAQLVALRRWLKRLLGLSVVLLIGAIALNFLWPEWMSAAPGDELFGPFDGAGAQRDLLLSLLHTAVTGVLLLAVAMAGRRGAEWRAPLFLLVLIGELCVAQQWMLPVVADAELPPPFTVDPRTEVTEPDAPTPLRYFRAYDDGFAPPSFATTRSPQRLREVVDWNCATVFPKHELGAGLASVETPGLAMSADYAALLEVARRHGPARPDGFREPPANTLQFLGAFYLILPAGFEYSHCYGEERLGENARLWWNADALRFPFEYGYLATNPRQLPLLTTHSQRALLARTEEVLFPSEVTGGIERPHVIEGRMADAAPSAAAPSRSSTVSNAISLTAWRPGAMTFAVDTRENAWLIAGEGFDVHWQARIWNADAVEPIAVQPLRADRVFLGLPVPAGHSVVQLVYCPAPVFWGAAVSGLSWVAVIAVCLAGLMRRRAVPPTTARGHAAA